MGSDILVTVIAALAFAVGITGIIVPVLPGSITIIIGTLIWAIVIGGTGAWVAFAVITLLSLVGMTCSYVLTGRQLKRQETPGWAVALAIVGGLVGFFVIPGPGLILGFILALFGTEYARRKDANEAVRSTLTALKALGIGILLEAGCALISATIFILVSGYHFFA